MAWHGLVLAGDDALGQLMEGLGVERRLESGHFVEQHSKRPDVRLEVVAFALDDLRGEVVRRPHDCLGSRLRI